MKTIAELIKNWHPDDQRKYLLKNRDLFGSLIANLRGACESHEYLLKLVDANAVVPQYLDRDDPKNPLLSGAFFHATWYKDRDVAVAIQRQLRNAGQNYAVVPVSRVACKIREEYEDRLEQVYQALEEHEAANG